MFVVANTYGSTAHLSPLLRKMKHLGFPTPDSLLRLAVARGCAHYALANEATADEMKDPGTEVLSDIELGIAMISGAQDYSPQLMRCAAQLLSGPNIDPRALARAARMERCTPLLRYIAEQARQQDEGHESYWESVLANLPRATHSRPSESWPHPSRFMLLAGYRRGGGTHKPHWLRPRPRNTT